MNPLLNNGNSFGGNNIFNMLQQFNQFKSQMAGQDPQKILNDMIQSGKVSKEQVAQATEMAKNFSQFLK